jgi:uncharacterized protein (TIGR02246 family)
MPLETSDTVAILQLYAKYNTAIDTGDGAAFGSCFVPDGIFDSGGAGEHIGHEAISEFAVKTHDNMPGMRHNTTNIVVEGDANEATGSGFLIGYVVDGGYKPVVTGRYADELVRTGDGWRFAKRAFTVDS